MGSSSSAPANSGNIEGASIAEAALSAEQLGIRTFAARVGFRERIAGLRAFKDVLYPVYSDPNAALKLAHMPPEQAIMCAAAAESMEQAAISGPLSIGFNSLGITIFEFALKRALGPDSPMAKTMPVPLKAVLCVALGAYDGALPPLVHASLCMMSMGDARAAPAVRAIFNESAPASTLPDDARRVAMRVAALTGKALASDPPDFSKEVST